MFRSFTIRSKLLALVVGTGILSMFTLSGLLMLNVATVILHEMTVKKTTALTQSAFINGLYGLRGSFSGTYSCRTQLQATRRTHRHPSPHGLSEGRQVNIRQPVGGSIRFGGLLESAAGESRH